MQAERKFSEIFKLLKGEKKENPASLEFNIPQNYPATVKGIQRLSFFGNQELRNSISVELTHKKFFLKNFMLEKNNIHFCVSFS